MSSNTETVRTDPETDASAGYRLEYAYQACRSASESVHSNPDRIAAMTREDRPERYRRKHVDRRSS